MKIVNARIIEKNGSVFQENICNACGNTLTLIAESSDWYFENVNFSIKTTPPKVIHTQANRGCPYDCGICSWHENAPNLPVFSITNACNLNCPICFTYNRKDKTYFMSKEEMKKTVDFLLKSKDKYDLINITGGEPTLHPEIIELLEISKSDRIGRITMNSNGLRIAEDEKFVQELSRLGVYIILSFDTLDRETSIKIHGADIVAIKMKALENLRKYNVGTTLLNVMIKGVNDHEISDIISLAMEYCNIRSVTIQTMTFTGQGGSNFQPRERLTLDMAARLIEEQSSGMIKRDSFFPLPSNHPLCYSIAYFFKNGRTLQSFTDILHKDDLVEMVGSNYIMHPDDRFHQLFNEAIAKNWSDGTSLDTLSFIRRLLKKMYPSGGEITPFERQRIAEESILTIYIHAHMDAENFDMSRIVCCSDLVPVDGEKLIPACAYNLFYRMHDERFWKEYPGE